jgi:ribosomal small subunit protein bTHX
MLPRLIALVTLCRWPTHSSANIVVQRCTNALARSPARLCLLAVLIPCTTPTYRDSHMGKGDKRTKRGKIFRGSYGKTRVHKKGGKTKAAKKANA